MHPVRLCAGLTVAVVVGVLSGCSGHAESGSGKPVTLVLTTYDEDGTLGADLVRHFVDEVNTLNPTVSITVRFRGSPEEPDAVTAVSSGSSDMAMVASRAFDSAGVTTLQALNTPFLIDSNELADAVATSDEVPELMAGMNGIGVIGLGIAPEGLRHLFGVQRAMVSVADLDGIKVRAPQSQVVWSMLSDAGATPIFDDSQTYAAAESQYDEAPGTHATGNVTFFAKFDVLAINQRVAKKLAPAQLAALRQAASESTTWAIAHVPTDSAMATKFCANGGTISAASDTELAAWKSAVQPVVAHLEALPSTAKLIDAITTMKQGLKATGTVTRCPSSSSPQAASSLDGVYTYTVTVDQLVTAGIEDESFIVENAGPYRMTFKDGKVSTWQRYVAGPKKGTIYTATSNYTLVNDRIKIQWDATPTNFTVATVSVTKDGSLEFSNIEDGNSNPKFLLLDQVAMRHWHKVS